MIWTTYIYVLYRHCTAELRVLFNRLSAELFWSRIKISNLHFQIYPDGERGMGNWNSYFWRIRYRSSTIYDAMSAGDLATKGAWTSVPIILSFEQAIKHPSRYPLIWLMVHYETLAMIYRNSSVAPKGQRGKSIEVSHLYTMVVM